MARPKGSRLTAEHRERIAAGQRRRHAERQAEPVTCEGCGRPFNGEVGRNIHLALSKCGRMTEA